MKKKLEPILELEISPLVGPDLKFEPDLGPLIGIEFGPNKQLLSRNQIWNRNRHLQTDPVYGLVWFQPRTDRFTSLVQMY